MFSRGGRGEDGGLVSVVDCGDRLARPARQFEAGAAACAPRVRFGGEGRRVDAAGLAHRRLPAVHGPDVAAVQYRGRRGRGPRLQLHVLSGARCGAGLSRSGRASRPRAQPTGCSAGLSGRRDAAAVRPTETGAGGHSSRTDDRTAVKARAPDAGCAGTARRRQAGACQNRPQAASRSCQESGRLPRTGDQLPPAHPKPHQEPAARSAG